MKRTISISTTGISLSVHNSQLVVRNDGTTISTIPLEDIGLVSLEAPGIRLSSGALLGITEAGAVVMACNEQHLPASICIPVAANSLHAEKVRHQCSASEPMRKNIWKKIVVSKIRNQRDFLNNEIATRRLDVIANKVKSGDPSNCEAQAAKTYWRSCFPEAADKFRRDKNGEFPNSLLNYGYAVLRAATARALCCAGLHPGIGVHHHNRYSGFPLADDLMEPYRPWVDEIAREEMASGKSSLGKAEKAAALRVLTRTVGTSSGLKPLMSALEWSAATLAKAFHEFGAGNLGAPQATTLLELPHKPEGSTCA